jgi:hypothetical protein
MVGKYPEKQLLIEKVRGGKMKKIIYGLAAIIIILAVLSVMEVRRHSSPWIRGGVAIPIFTIGDESFARDLAKGKKVVKYGPMFFGLYHGGRAFAMISEAVEYLESENKDLSKWGVYLLAGDYLIDVDRTKKPHSINKTLLVINQANIQ